jgi:DNA-binding NtrC family response regulator
MSSFDHTAADLLAIMTVRRCGDHRIDDTNPSTEVRKRKVLLALHHFSLEVAMSGTRTILIIDDEEIIRVLLRSALKAVGYEVVVAANGRQGLELYRQRPTDLIITDIAMPELNGLDMILELTPQFLRAKVIAISGVGGKKNVFDVGKLLGARQTLQKPFNMPQLLGAVRYELEH